MKKLKVYDTSVSCVEFATSDQIICCDEKGSVAFVNVSTNIIHQFDSEHKTKINNIQVSPHKVSFKKVNFILNMLKICCSVLKSVRYIKYTLFFSKKYFCKLFHFILVTYLFVI